MSIMACRVLSGVINRLQCDKIIKNVRTIHTIRLSTIQQHEITQSALKISKNFLGVNYNLNCTTKRWKSNRNKKKGQSQLEDSDDEDDDIEELDFVEGKNSKVITPTTTSMRIDAVAKSGLGISRNKIEVALYESRLRINGEKVLKKGQSIYINDVVDLIVGPSPKNPNFTLVHRITILDAEPNVDNIKLKVLREKNLVVDEYKDSYKIESDE